MRNLLIRPNPASPAVAAQSGFAQARPTFQTRSCMRMKKFVISRRNLLTASAAGLVLSTTGLPTNGFAQTGIRIARIWVGFPPGGTPM
jgi:hypothetical protein